MVKSKSAQSKKITSYMWGIMGIVLSLFFPVIGMVFGIIGLAVRKGSNNPKRDLALNVAAIAIGVLGLVTYSYK
jgi:hypothetical protein